MRSLLFASAALLLLPSSVVVAAAPPPSRATVTSGNDNACPVSFQVRRNSPGLVANAQDAASHRGSQRIYFTLQPPQQNTVQSIEITVHALSPKLRLSPAAFIEQPAPDIDRDFKLTGAANVGLHGRNLWVEGVGGILSVDLTSILYVDGSTWHASPSSICHAVPDSFTLITATAADQPVRSTGKQP